MARPLWLHFSTKDATGGKRFWQLLTSPNFRDTYKFIPFEWKTKKNKNLNSAT